MRKGFVVVGLCCLTLPCFIANSANSASFTIDDQTNGATTFWGGLNDKSWNGEGLVPMTSDVFGSPSHFGVDGITISATQTSLTAIVTGPFFSFTTSASNTKNIYAGDLFLSNTGWIPYQVDASDVHYASDNAATGEHWEYVISMDNRNGLTGDLKLYEVLTTGTIETPEVALAGVPMAYRTGQEYRYIPVAGGQDVLGTGTWTINSLDGTLTYNLTTFLLGTTLADLYDAKSGEMGIHWTMTCGNDVLEGVGSPVPEPATMLLLGTGLMSLVGLKRRRSK